MRVHAAIASQHDADERPRAGTSAARV